MFIRKLSKKSKYSYTISIPKDLIDKFRWQEHQKLTLKLFGKNKIVIADWKPKSRKK